MSKSMQNSKKFSVLNGILANTGIELTYKKEPKITMYTFTYKVNDGTEYSETAAGYNEAVLIARGIALAKRTKENN